MISGLEDLRHILQTRFILTELSRDKRTQYLND